MGCLLVWRKPWLIRLCFVVWASAQCLFESLVLRHLVIAHASNIKKLLNELFPQGFFFNSLRGKRKCHYKQFFFLHRIAGLHRRHGGHADGQEQMYFSPMGTKLYFQVNSSTKNSIVLSPNMAAL